MIARAAAATAARRSALYLPGSNLRALAKAKTLPADVLLLDCEDAVAPDKKEQARAQICGALASDGFGGREAVVRINSLESSWGEEDAAQAAAAGADAILLPKAESVEQVERLAALLQRQASESPSATPPSIWCMVEPPAGVLRAEALAAHPHVACLVAGTSDLSADLRCDGAYQDRLALLPSLSLIVLAARAHGKAVLDGVHLDLDDEAGFVAACLQGRALGFDGKTLIHPKTLEPANRVFAPSPAEVDRARRVVAAFADAAAAGSALVVLDGKLVEELHVRSARRLLALNEAINELVAVRASTAAGLGGTELH